MKAKDLKAESIYVCSTPQGDIHVLFYGMSQDKYVFIPYDLQKRHYNGRPNGLTEKEVSKQIKSMAQA
ncbi:hypothetical protein [Dysgonomonas sp. GY617]|uniref:hypothetical protein n=1 Tax=Dysgonomonas sp. GY617 TaxID=2780420 RepID=UPI0018839C1F|nr:hypothetical protein [Dysgonomonas sp. GY617]MBF0576632.1 hypothetical protein [Dysgonomonas sp. GY617]